MTQTRVRLWTVNEYHRMLETGIITEDERVELTSPRICSRKHSPLLAKERGWG
ncbi:hypothetical protein [Nostoc sp.]|uniref:hypothetical protein n=1 Tax=Nostoc sp. TaxID=1180 RepID=UPI002FF48A38